MDTVDHDTKQITNCNIDTINSKDTTISFSDIPIDYY